MRKETLLKILPIFPITGFTLLVSNLVMSGMVLRRLGALERAQHQDPTSPSDRYENPAPHASPRPSLE